MIFIEQMLCEHKYLKFERVENIKKTIKTKIINYERTVYICDYCGAEIYNDSPLGESNE